jgi:hypothetical protein
MYACSVLSKCRYAEVLSTFVHTTCVRVCTASHYCNVYIRNVCFDEIEQGAKLLIRAHDTTAAVTNGNSNSNSSNGSGTTSHTNSNSCCSVENLTAAHFVLHVSSSAYSSHASTQQHHHTTSKAGSRSRSSSVSAVKIAPKESTTTTANSSISSSCSVSSSTSSSASTAVSAKTRRHSLKHMIAETQVRSGMMNSSSSSANSNKHTLLSSSSSSYNGRDIELDLQCTTPYERSRWQLALLLAVHGSNGSGADGSLTVHDVNRVLRGTTQTTVKQQLQGLADTANTTGRHISSKAFGLTVLAVVKFNSKRRIRQRLSELLSASGDERVQQQQQQHEQQQQQQQQQPVSV